MTCLRQRLLLCAGREGKFFPKDFKCPICGADKDQFWDMNDPNDPRNQVLTRNVPGSQSVVGWSKAGVRGTVERSAGSVTGFQLEGIAGVGTAKS